MSEQVPDPQRVPSRGVPSRRAVRLFCVALGLAALVVFAFQPQNSSERGDAAVDRWISPISAKSASGSSAVASEPVSDGQAALDAKASRKASKSAPGFGGVEVLDTSLPRQSSQPETDDGVATATETGASQEINDMVTMTLLHNNDGESKLLADAEQGFPGIARFAATWIDLGRSSNADILLRVSAGDNFLASKEFSAGLAREGEPLFDSIALRGLYEAVGLGNHDFDFGPDVTARFIEGFRINTERDQVPFLAANVDVSAEPLLNQLADEGQLVPSTVITDPLSGEQVGVIGLVTPRLPNISSPRGVEVSADIANVVNAQVDRLSEDGIDRIVLVSHLQGIGEDEALISELSGVDIVVAGGGDELLRNEEDSCQQDEEPVGPYPLLVTDADGNEILVVTAPGGYRCIGRLDVTFDAEGQVARFNGSSIAVELDGEQEPFALARVEDPLTEALAALNASIVGESDVVLDGRRASVRTGPSNAGELLADALLSAGRSADDFGGETPVVAVQNSGGIRNDAEIPAGEISEADTFDIAPFANFVVTGAVPRDQFKEMLEIGVSGLPDAEGTFPQIAGFSMDIDGSLPSIEVDRDGECQVGEPGERVRAVTLDDGTVIVQDGEVVPGDDIVLATIDFLAGGGDCYPLADLDFVQVGQSYQQALASFIANDLGGVISADAYPEGGSSRISIVGVDGDLAAEVDEPDATADEEVEDTTTEDGAPEQEETEDGAPEQEAAEEEPAASETELAQTGADPALLLVMAVTIVAAGALVFVESRRTGWLSLAARLRTSSATPDGD